MKKFRFWGAILIALVLVAPAQAQTCADPGDESTSVVDTIGDAGNHNSIAVGSDGYAVVASYSDGKLKLWLENPACVSPVVLWDYPGQFPFVALDSANRARVSYYGTQFGDLHHRRCVDVCCTSNTVSAVVQTADVGLYSSLAINAAGNSVMIHRRHGNGDVIATVCNDQNCYDNDETTTTVVGSPGLESSTPMKLDADGFPVFAYHDVYNQTINLVHCNDDNCAGGDESNVVIATGIVGVPYLGLDLTSDGLARVSFYHSVKQIAKLFLAANANGTSGVTVTLDNTKGAGRFTATRVDSANLAVVTFSGATGTLNVARCNDVANCATRSLVIADFDIGKVVGFDTALALDASNNPVIAHHGYTDGDLRVTTCNDPSCTPAPPVCPASPQVTCRASTGSSVTVVESTDRLNWVWNGGDTTAADMGCGNYTYAVCMYDAAGLVMTAEVPSALSCPNCWRTTTTGSLRYNGGGDDDDDIQYINVTPGVTNAEASVKGLGPNLPLPGPLAPPLYFTTPVTVQLINSIGECWGASYDPNDIDENDVGRFEARN